jgi:PAS domain S-box-containing protein
MTLEEYAIWLKENRLEELAAKNLEIVKQMNIPLLSFFEYMPEETLLARLTQNLAEFLVNIAEGTAWDHLQQNLRNWEDDKLQFDIPKSAIHPSDIILANNAQCRAVITFLPEFTDSADVAISIVNEFSDYYSKAQQLGFETLIRIRERSDESFHLLVSSIQDAAIFRLDTKGYIQSWNPGAQRLKGYTEEEIIGRHFSIFYPEEDIKDGKPERELETVVAEGRYEEEGWRLRKDGSRFWAKVVITPIYAAGGRLVGFAKLTQDLTEHLYHERSLNRKNQELSRYINDTYQFARVTAHELKEPLHVISTFIKMLQKNYQDDTAADPTTSKYRQIIQEKTQLMRRQLDAMQEFMSVNIVAAGTQSADLNVVLDKVKMLLSKEIKETGAMITVSDLPVVPYAPSHMVPLFRNLVDNALKFHNKEQAPHIEVSAKRTDGSWLFSVKDDGPEIGKEYHEKIFEMFRRLDQRGAFPGVGIGLTICKKIVELNGGKIWVETQPGNGNTFLFTLPTGSR